MSVSTERIYVPLKVCIRSAAIDGDLEQMRFPGVPPAFLREWTAKADGAFVAVVSGDDEEHVVGQILFSFCEARQGQRCVYFYFLHVVPFVRGYGIGSALLARVEDVGREQTCYAASLGVSIDNRFARELYERRGYVVYSDRTVTVPEIGEVREHLMAKWLTNSG